MTEMPTAAVAPRSFYHLTPVPESEVEISAIRAQGAGGQNVNKLSSAIHLRFSLPAAQPAPLAKLAKQADRAAAFIEATHLADFAFEEAEKFFGLPCVRLAALDSYLAPLTSDEAEAQFLVRFNQLEEDISA